MAIMTVPYKIVQTLEGSTAQTFTGDSGFVFKYLTVVNRGTGNLTFLVKDIGKE